MRRPRRSDRVPVRYRALQAWARIAVSVFYRDAGVTAAARMPSDGRIIWAANHGNALADVAVIVARQPQFPHFLAAASWWKSAPARLLFDLGGVIPIHRRRDGENAEANASAFSSCYAALGSGAEIVIFPEGEMEMERGLLPLKTGAARIALGAAADAGLTGVVLVPVGLVYDDRGTFRSDAEMHLGEGIEIDDWIETYRSDPVDTVRRLTELLASRLEHITMNGGSAEEAAVLDHVAKLALAEPAASDEFARRNQLRRALRSAVALAGGETSVEYKGVVAALETHQRDLVRLGLDPADAMPLDSTPSDERVRLIAELVALSPAAALGAAVNAPTLIVLLLASRRVPHEAWQATVKGVGGTVLSPVVWTLTFHFLSHRVGRRRALALTAGGAVGGVAALAWRERLLRMRVIARRDAAEREQPVALREAQASRAALKHCVELLVGEGSRPEKARPGVTS